jgi:hypothetical protein
MGISLLIEIQKFQFPVTQLSSRLVQWASDPEFMWPSCRYIVTSNAVLLLQSILKGLWDNWRSGCNACMWRKMPFVWTNYSTSEFHVLNDQKYKCFSGVFPWGKVFFKSLKNKPHRWRILDSTSQSGGNPSLNSTFHEYNWTNKCSFSITTCYSGLLSPFSLEDNTWTSFDSFVASTIAGVLFNYKPISLTLKICLRFVKKLILFTHLLQKIK